MWLIPVLELLFASGVAALASDLFASRFGSRRPYLPGAIASIGAAASLAMVASELGAYRGGAASLQPAGSLLASLYLVDDYSTLAALTILTLGLAVSVYSLRLPTTGRRPGPFYALLVFLLCSLVGVVSAGDLLTLFLFWEGMSVSAYALVGFWRSSLSVEAGLKYFFLAGLGSLLFVYGAAVVYAATGSIELSAIASAASQGTFGTLGLAVLVAGLGVEAAVVPLHTWLPDVYSAAPLPVASVVSGAVTATGVFAISKVLRPLSAGGAPQLQIILVALALATMLVGNLSALSQTNLRRMLSFSSVAQTGYMLAALSTFTTAGLVAAVFTIWNHGLLKSGFFMALGSGRPEYSDADFSSMRGAGRTQRAAGFFYAAASFGMMGAPPFGMFWSELLIVQSLLLGPGPLFTWVALAVALNIVLSIGYYFRVVNTVVFSDPVPGAAVTPSRDLVPPYVLLALSLATGILPFVVLGWI